VRSIRSECLGKLVLLGENHFRTAAREYVAHCHTERNHQGLESRLIEPPALAAEAGAIDCLERLGGLLRFCHRQAA
jgi:putative transposase